MCNVAKYSNVIEVFPGEPFELNIVAVGQRMGIVPATIIAEISDSDGNLGKEQDIQSTGKYCSPLEYRVHSREKQLTLSLRISLRNSKRYLQKKLPSSYNSTLFIQFMVIVSNLRSAP